jgi:hypothetical protein
LSARFSKFRTFVHPSPLTNNQQIPAEQPPRNMLYRYEISEWENHNEQKKNCCSTVLQDLLVIEEKVAFTLQNLKNKKM